MEGSLNKGCTFLLYLPLPYQFTLWGKRDKNERDIGTEADILGQKEQYIFYRKWNKKTKVSYVLETKMPTLKEQHVRTY